MTQEDKDLLLIDLCARLPYEVKVNEAIQGDFTLIGLTKERVFTTCEVEGKFNDFPIELIKPYLFPLSSMSDEQLPYYITTLKYSEETRGMVETPNSFDWLNAHHFDYRGLIEKGLALDATELVFIK